MERLKRRQDFAAAAKASYAAVPGMVVQARNREDGKPARVGFTTTKKLGNAVVRNRIRRRLRETARALLAQKALTGYDYVLIGRVSSGERPYAMLLNDLDSALRRLHGAPYRPLDKGKQ